MAFRRMNKLFLLALLVAALAVIAAGCGGGDDEETTAATTEAPAEATTEATEAATTEAPAEETTEETTEAPATDLSSLSGSIEADGSSTVGPLTTAAAELFREQASGVNVTVGISGTGGGFERFCVGETDISDASRPIHEDEETEGIACTDNGIEYTELPVAVDALTVVVNPANDWATCLTVDQLKTIWEPGAEGTITNWNQVDPSFPDVPLVLAGPGTDSGTFDYFTDVINGEEGASRADYSASEDDNVIVQAVAGDEGALGYFGYTYYEENQDSLKAVEVDGGSGCVAPSPEAAQDGSYAPLSRPLFIYVNNAKLAENAALGPFVQYYLDNIDTITQTALFIPPTPEEIETAKSNLAAALG
jgi:phosphate binding protein